LQIIITFSILDVYKFHTKVLDVSKKRVQI
jgi:hypothetical protein